MRVTLNQDELFEAISNHLISKLNLDSAANIEISLTAGRSPKGYTADVDITYPKAENTLKITAKDADDAVATETAVVGQDNAVVVDAATAGGAVPADKLFGT